MTTYLVDSPSQTVDDIVQNIISSCRLPVSQITFTPQIIIGFLQDEQDITVTSIINSIREDYWLTYNDQQIVQGTYNYSMPNKATAGSLIDVVFVDASGWEIEVPHLDTAQLKSPSYFAFRPSWQGQGYFLKNDQVVLWPQTWNNSAYLLRQKHNRQPNALTSSGNCMQITAVDVTNNQISFIGSPPFTVGQYIDIIPTTGQHVAQAEDLLISALVGSLLTFDSSTPITSRVTVGSWACPSGLTCIPQLPKEGNALLLARGMLRIAAALQNSNLFNVASKLAEDSAAKLVTMLTPRVQSGPKKFVNKNTIGGPYSFPYYR